MILYNFIPMRMLRMFLTSSKLEMEPKFWGMLWTTMPLCSTPFLLHSWVVPNPHHNLKNYLSSNVDLENPLLKILIFDQIKKKRTIHPWRLNTNFVLHEIVWKHGNVTDVTWHLKKNPMSSYTKISQDTLYNKSN